MIAQKLPGKTESGFVDNKPFSVSFLVYSSRFLFNFFSVSFAAFNF